MSEAERTHHAFRISITLILSVIAIVSIVFVTVSVTDPEDSEAASGIINKGDYYYRIISMDGSENLVELYMISTEKTGAVSIPEKIEDSGVDYEVIGIADEACMDRSSIMTLSISDTVTYIGDYAFKGCSKLSKITGMNNVSSIGEHAFEGCSSLEKFYLYSDIVTIEPYTFSGCTSMEEFSFPDTVLNFEKYAFEKCQMISEFTIPKNLQKVGDYAFTGCTRLITANLPDTVTYVGTGAYSGCTSLIYAHIPNTITDLKGSMFMGCSSIQTIDFSEDVEWIGSYTFAECINLTSITITSNVNLIGSFAFYGIEFYNFEETQEIKDYGDLPGYTYILKEPAKMIRQEIYAVHYNPNGGPDLADDEPHVAGQYFIPTKIESGVLVCENWIYDGKTYHYGDKILMPGEDITLDCVWTQADTPKKEDPSTETNDTGPVGMIAAIIIGVVAVAIIGVGVYVLVKRRQ